MPGCRLRAAGPFLAIVPGIHCARHWPVQIRCLPILSLFFQLLWWPDLAGMQILLYLPPGPLMGYIYHILCIAFRTIL